MDTATPLNQTAKHLLALPLVIKAAEAAGLPMPETITVNDYRPVLWFATEAEVQAWSEYVDVPVRSVVLDGGTGHHSFDADLFDLPIELLAVVEAEAVSA